MEGVSRSAAIVAYLIYTQIMTYETAYDLYDRKRARISGSSFCLLTGV